MTLARLSPQIKALIGGLRPAFNSAASMTIGTALLFFAACEGGKTPDDGPGHTPGPVDAPSKPAEVTMPKGAHLLVLGTAQDGGFPHASCDCSRCSAAVSGAIAERRVASLALIQPQAKTRYLFDATPDIKPQLRMLAERSWPAAGHKPGVNRQPLDGVFLTHAHMGHYLGLAYFGFEAVHTKDLPVYTTLELAAFLASNAPWDQLVKLKNIELKPSQPGAAIELDAVRVTPVVVPHRDEYANTVAYVFEGPTRKALYIPDCQPWRNWPDGISRLSAGIDVLILDGAFADPSELPGRSLDQIGHPMISETMDRWQAQVKAGKVEVVFTHLNHSNEANDPRSATAEALRQRGFRVLADGDVITL